MIARAAYFSGVPLWEQTVMNDLQSHYEDRPHPLTDPPSPAQGTAEEPELGI
jgi:hypothetical protein